MTCAGDPGLWAGLFPDGLVPEILCLILRTWAGAPQFGGDELEVPITLRFCERLRQHKDAKRLPFLIWPETPETDAHTGAIAGRIDIRFIHGYQERVYFALECKRLNVVRIGGRRESLARDYVDDGMMRFVEGKYAANLDKGGMLGYVMDGNVPGAQDSVKAAIVSRKAKLCMDRRGDLRTSSVLPGDGRLKQTSHRLGSVEFALHHVFLAVEVV